MRSRDRKRKQPSAGKTDTSPVPDAEVLLGGNPNYVASLRRILALSAEFQGLLTESQRTHWLEVEEALLAHFLFLHRASYLAGLGDGATGHNQQLGAIVRALLHRLALEYQHED